MNRLPRLLALVPWLLQHPNSRLADVASHFGVTDKQLLRDLDLLWICGLPGYYPHYLLDFAFEEDRVTVTEPQTLDRPLRLTGGEATALLVAARALAQVGGLAERDALERAITKLAAVAPLPDDIDVTFDPQDELLATLRSAIEKQVAVHLSYFVEARDELTERDVDPLRVVSSGGRWYLDAWCRRAQDFRYFRLDRIQAAGPLGEPSAAPPRAADADLADGLYTPAPGDVPVVIDVPPASRWVQDVYKVDSVQDLDGGWARVSLRTADLRPLARLLLSLDAACGVVQPACLTEQVRDVARSALAGYGSG